MTAALAGEIEVAATGESTVSIESPPADEGGPPPWEPPPEIAQHIERFNAVHRVIWRTVRSEIGARAALFVRHCCEQVDAGDLMDGADLQIDGTWSVEGLRRAIVAHHVVDPWPAYQKLIDREIELLRTHIGEARAARLLDEVRLAERAAATH